VALGCLSKDFLEQPAPSTCLAYSLFGDHHREVVVINQSFRVPKKITPSSLKNLHACYYLCHSKFHISHPHSHACHYFHALSIPIPLPQQQSPMAPCFDPKNPSTLCTYLLNYESLAKVVQLFLGKCLAQSTCYLTKEDKDDWENLPEFEAMLPDLDVFKEVLFREDPDARKLFISSADLGKFVDEKSKQEINTLDEFATFNWEFRRLATWLAKEKRVSANGLDRAYEKSIHPEL